MRSICDSCWFTRSSRVRFQPARSAACACRPSPRRYGPTSCGGTPASRPSSVPRPAPAITNSTSRPRRNGRPIASIAIEAGCALRRRSAQRGSRRNQRLSATSCTPRWSCLRPVETSGVSVSRRSSKKPAAVNHTGRWRIRPASRISTIPIALRSNCPKA